MLKRLTTGILIALIVSSCSSLRYWQLNPSEKLQHLLDQQEYQLALNLIDKQTTTSELKKQRSQVLKRQQKAIQSTLKSKQQLVKKRQWQQAFQLLNTALAKSPDSSQLKKALANTLHQQQSYIKQQRLALALEQANNLSRTKPIINKLLNADPKLRYYQKQQQQDISNADYNFQLLMSAANETAQKKQWAKARTFIRAAQSLKHSEELQKLAFTVDKALAKASKNHRNRSRNKQHQYILHLIDELALSKKQGEWQKSQQTIEALNSFKSLPPTQQALVDQAKTEIAAHIQHLIEQGQHHYTRGQLEKAITNWQQSLDLAPENSDIQQRLQRAKRFKTNIDQLE